MTITILTNLRHSEVITPPNGFAGSTYPIGSLAPISGMVYASLMSEKAPIDNSNTSKDSVTKHSIQLED
jgi:hypothetical protein